MWASYNVLHHETVQYGLVCRGGGDGNDRRYLWRALLQGEIDSILQATEVGSSCTADGH